MQPKMMGDPIFYPDSVHIENSHECSDRYLQLTIIRSIQQYPRCPDCVRTRSETSLLNEWVAHNVLYDFGIKKERTGSVYFDKEPLWRCFAYSIIANYGMIVFILAVTAMIGIAMMFGSCKSAQQYIVVHDTIENTIYKKDIETIHDSIYTDRWHDRYIKGDTIYMRDSVLVVRYRDRDVVKVDTMYLYKSAETPYPVPVVEEKKVRGFFWWAGLVAWVGAVAYSAIKIYRYIKKRYSKGK